MGGAPTSDASKAAASLKCWVVAMIVTSAVQAPSLAGICGIVATASLLCAGNNAQASLVGKVRANADWIKGWTIAALVLAVIEVVVFLSVGIWLTARGGSYYYYYNNAPGIVLLCVMVLPLALLTCAIGLLNTLSKLNRIDEDAEPSLGRAIGYNGHVAPSVNTAPSVLAAGSLAKQKPVDPLQRIKDLKELLDSNAITQEEFDSAKARMLSAII